MIYWIVLGAVVLFAATLIFIESCSYEHEGFRYWVYRNIEGEWPHVVIGSMCVLFVIVFVIMSIFVIDAQICSNQYKAEYMAQYEVLNYSVHHMPEDNIDELYKMELYSQVKEYNADVAGHKAQLENPWVDVFVSPCFEDVPLIELE